MKKRILRPKRKKRIKIYNNFTKFQEKFLKTTIFIHSHETKQYFLITLKCRQYLSVFKIRRKEFMLLYFILILIICRHLF